MLQGAEGLTIDVSGKVADATTSFAASPVTGVANGQKISLLVENDEALGKPAFLVVVDQLGQTIFKHPVVVGEN